MHIESVRVYALSTPLAQPFCFSQGWVHRRSSTLVEITTNTGITGWGEAFTQGLEPPQIAAAAIESALTPLLLQQNPLAVEVLWHRMYHATRDYGRKGSVMAAISAVDIALWDIAGKFYEVPIHQLMGGPFRTRVEAYATGFYRLSDQDESARFAEEALAHHHAGFRCMKVKLGFGLASDRKAMSAIAAALQGREAFLMVDTNHAYGVSDAIRLGRSLEEFNLRWYEEPVAPEHVSGYREVRQACAMPIAGGENEHSLYGFRDLFAAGALDVAQPDIGSTGGFTACRHIVALAQAHGVKVNPHVWGSAIAQAASLQLIAALPVPHHSVFPEEPIFEYDRSSHPFRMDLITQPILQRDGFVDIPNGPGLGVEVVREVLTRFTV